MCAATPSLGSTLSDLCVACKSIFDGSTLKNDNGEVEHHGLDALAARASRGCHLCLTVYMSIDPEAYKRFKKSSSNRHVVETLGFACVIPIARDQARLKFRYVKTSMMSTVTENGHEDGTSPKEDKGKGREGDMVTPTPSMSSSKLSLPLSVNSGEKDEGKAPVVVELILMNPRCMSSLNLRTYVSLTWPRCGRAWSTEHQHRVSQHRVATELRSGPTMDRRVLIQSYEVRRQQR